MTTHGIMAKLILTNLLQNDLKFHAPGAQPRVPASIETLGRWCRIAVEDNGIGMPSEHVNRLFKPFVRLHDATRYPGFGLGLATAVKAAKLINARLGVSSQPGEGSTFWVELPAVTSSE